MIELILLVIRGVQAVFAIILLGLTGDLVSRSDGALSRVNYMLFNSIWTVLILVFLGLAPRFIQHTFIKLACVGLDLLTALFWFSGFIALAVLLNSDVVGYEYGGFVSYYNICSGTSPACSELKAATVFGAFEWALFCASTALSAMDVFRNRNKSSTQQPSVSQPAV